MSNKYHVSPKWGEELNNFKEHDSLESCSDWLPRPKRKLEHLLTQCPKCGKIYVGAIVPPTGTPFWKPIAFSKGENE